MENIKNKIFNKWDETKRQIEIIRAGEKLTTDEKNNILNGYAFAKSKRRLTEEQRILIDDYMIKDKGTLIDCWFN
jgi:hypothetical protein